MRFPVRLALGGAWSRGDAPAGKPETPATQVTFEKDIAPRSPVKAFLATKPSFAGA